MNGQRVVFADVETSGLFHDRHQIIQLAAVAVDADWNEVESFEAKLLFDMARADAGALAKNHFDAEVWAREAVDQEVGRLRFSAFLDRYRCVTKMSKAGRPYTVTPMAGHNFPGFDKDFIATWYDPSRAAPGCGMPTKAFCSGAWYEALDTLALARWVTAGLPLAQQPRDHKLETLCEWSGNPIQGAHDALVDIRATVGLARHLLDYCGFGWLRENP